MPTIAVTIVDQTVAVIQAGEIGPTGPTGATGSVSSAGSLTITTPAATPTRAIDIDGSTTAFSYAAYENTSGSLWWGVEGSSAGQLFGSSLAYASLLGSSNGTALQLGTNGGVRITIDTSGNTGFGNTAPGTKVDVTGVIRASGGTVPASANNIALNYVAGSTAQLVGHGPDNSTPAAFQLVCVSANESAGDIRLAVGSTGHITPGSDNAQDFGGGSLRWRTIYAGTGTINTSDERYKVLREGGDLTAAEYLAWSNVRAIVYQDKDSYDRKGDEARLHVGYSWQAIRAAFAAQGLDAGHYGLWCEDPAVAPVSKTRTVTRQVMEIVEQPFSEVEIVDGAPVLVRGVRTVAQPVSERLQVRDAETGELVFYTPAVVPSPEGEEPVEIAPAPLMAEVPVMEEYEETYFEMEPTGETMGALRYQECAVLEAAWLRRQLALIEARVAALEGL